MEDTKHNKSTSSISNNGDTSDKVLVTSPCATGDRKRASARLITIEPVVLLIGLSLGIILALQPQFLRQLLADARNVTLPKPDRNKSNNCGLLNTSHPYFIILTEIQADVAYWQMVIILCSNLPSLIMAPLLGTYSDKVGRKVVLALATLGYAVTSSSYLIILYFDLPIWVLPIGSSIQGLTGGHGLIVALCVSYLTDITTKERRLTRIGIMHGIFTMGIAVTQLGIGYLINEAGFEPALWLTAAFVLVCFLYISFPSCLLETVDKNRRKRNKQAKARFQSLVDLIKNNTENRRLRLTLIFLIEFLGESLNSNSVAMVVIYGQGPPFCWGSIIVSSYLGLILFSTAFAAVVATTGLSLCLSDLWVLQVGMVFGVINGLFIAFVKGTIGVFVASLVGCLRAVTQPVVQTIMSKMVTDEERGVVFAIEASVLNLGTLLSPVFLNNIYSATVQTQPNFVFIMLGVCNIAPLVVTGILQFVTKRAETTPISSSNGANEGFELNEKTDI